MSLLNIIKNRRSTKSFDSQYNIQLEKIEHILESGRMAPSIYGLEPWFFLAIKDKLIIKDLLDIYMNQHNIKTGSCLIIILSLNQEGFRYFMNYKKDSRGQEHFPYENIEKYKKYISNKIKIENISSQQAFIALSFMMLAAESLDINTCPVAGFHKEDLKKYINDHQMFDKIAFYEPTVSLILGKKNDKIKPFKIRRRDAKDLIYKII